MKTKDNGKYNTAGSTGKKKRAAFNWLKGVTAVLCAVAMYFTVTIGIRGYDMYKDAIAQVSLEDKINEIRSKKSYTLFSDLPETYTDAVLSVEDHRFYGHIGIDPIAITRAMVNDMKAGDVYKRQVQSVFTRSIKKICRSIKPKRAGHVYNGWSKI